MSCAFLKGTLCHRAGSGYPCVERKSPVLPLRYIIRCEKEGRERWAVVTSTLCFVAFQLWRFPTLPITNSDLSALVLH